jgi:hypothetical protein
MLKVSKEKLAYIKKEYIDQRDYLCSYDLTMDLLTDSLFEEGDEYSLLQVCNFFFTDGDNSEEVKDAYETYLEEEYRYKY